MNAMNLNDVRVPKYLPWLVVLSAGMFFFYEFIQMQMFNAISQSLLADFHVGATTLGYMSSSFFLGNVLQVIKIIWLNKNKQQRDYPTSSHRSKNHASNTGPMN